MKTFITGTVALVAAVSLAGCTYYKTKEEPAPARVSTTVVVPQARPDTVVVPAPPSRTVRPMPSASSDSDTVTVDPDTTVVVSPNPN